GAESLSNADGSDLDGMCRWPSIFQHWLCHWALTDDGCAVANDFSRWYLSHHHYCLDGFARECCPARAYANFCDAELRSTAVRSQDRKSTRLNSSHVSISYAVFCLKKKIK